MKGRLRSYAYTILPAFLLTYVLISLFSFFPADIPVQLALMILGAEPELLAMVEVAGHGTRKLLPKRWNSLPVPLPSKDIQLDTVAKVRQFQDRINRLQDLQLKIHKEISAFTPALLAKAFRGEL